MIGRNPNVISVYFYYTRILAVVLNYFGRKNLLYASNVGKTRKYGSLLFYMRHRCEDNGYYDYKLTDFYLAVTESDSSYENIVCEIPSNKQIETREFYNMNLNSIIGFTRRCNRNEVTFYCRKCNHDFAYQDKYKIIPDKLTSLILSDGYQYVEEEI